LRCDGIFNDHFIAHVLQYSSERILNMWRSYDKNFVAYFYGPPCKSPCMYDSLYRTVTLYKQHVRMNVLQYENSLQENLPLRRGRCGWYMWPTPPRPATSHAWCHTRVILYSASTGHTSPI